MVALNCGESAVSIEVPYLKHVKKAVNVLEADIRWEESPEKSLDLSACKELPVNGQRLLLELEANSASLIWVTA